MTRTRIGLIIPAYNAAATLPRVMERIPAAINQRLHRVWVINDGSSDRTAEVVGRLSRRHDWLELVDLAQNRGYGGAVKEGLARARASGLDAAACLHADGQYAPEELPGLFEHLASQRLDILQGSRIAPGTALEGGMPLYKYLANRCLTTLENKVLALRMTDYHSGYLLYGRRALEQIPFDKLGDSFDFDLEVIATARARSLAIGEQPIPTCYADEISHLNPVTYGLRVLRVVARYRAGYYHRLAPPGPVDRRPGGGQCVSRL